MFYSSSKLDLKLFERFCARPSKRNDRDLFFSSSFWQKENFFEFSARPKISDENRPINSVVATGSSEHHTSTFAESFVRSRHSFANRSDRFVAENRRFDRFVKRRVLFVFSSWFFFVLFSEDENQRLIALCLLYHLSMDDRTKSYFTYTPCNHRVRSIDRNFSFSSSENVFS